MSPVRLVVAVTVIAAAIAVPAGGAAPQCAGLPTGWRPHVVAARDWARSRTGDVSFAVRADQRLYGSRERHVVPIASLLKPMLLAAYLDRRSVRARPLRQADLALLDPMIRRSDDLAAQRVPGIVGGRRDDHLRRDARLRQANAGRRVPAAAGGSARAWIQARPPRRAVTAPPAGRAAWPARRPRRAGRARR